MKVHLEKASDWQFKEYIEINTLEDLIALQKKYKEDLVVNFTNNNYSKEPFITIYDDYLE